MNNAYFIFEKDSEKLYEARCAVMKSAFDYIKLAILSLGRIYLPETEDALAITLYSKSVTHSAGWDGEDEITETLHFCEIEGTEYCLDTIDGKEGVDLMENIAIRIRVELMKNNA